MSSSCFIMKMDGTAMHSLNEINNDAKPLIPKEKVMSYEEKSVGSTAFFKCEACPYMALAEDDIKFHLFTVHPDLAKSNGLAENIQIPCPGCNSIFDTEETLRIHLRNHHKMGIKDVKKMIKSLVQIALKNTKLKKDHNTSSITSTSPNSQEIADVKIPQVIEIIPDAVATKNDLPKGVAFISVDELNKMSTPNFEKIDPKEIIQEASINIVYTNEVSTQYVNVADEATSSTSCNLIQVSSVTPDLISSVLPCVTSEANKLTSPSKDNMESQVSMPELNKSLCDNTKGKDIEKRLGKLCSVIGCHTRLKADDKLTYHTKCHQNGKLVCPECDKVLLTVEALHTHLWKVHEVDLELPTCEVCGFKTYKRYRLLNLHMKCHGTVSNYTCSICLKAFKNANQLSKHKLFHKKETDVVQCTICQKEFNDERKLKTHVSAVHEKLKPFKCIYCSYTSARKTEMKLHSRSHTGDKPYACNQCSYRSADHNALRRHKKQHTKEGVYKCKYCPYTTIQSTVFASHMISKHPNVNSTDIHQCPYCKFKTVNKEKYVLHLTTHRDKEGIQLLVDMMKVKTSKPSWNIPSGTAESPANEVTIEKEQSKESSPKTVNAIPIEVYDCDSFSESMPQDYSKTFCATSTNDVQPPDFNNQVIVTDLSKDDNNSDCLISESSNDTLMDRHQFTQQHPLEISYDNPQTNLHGFLNTSVSMEQSLLQSNNVNSLASSHSPIGNSIGNNIMSNFPIRLPPVPQISVRNNIMLKPVDKLSFPMTKVTGPIIKPTQILPVPSSSNSPVNISNEPEGVPRKKPKISVKSNLILKGPDEENMFHSQQKMAFKRLEDNERFGLGSPVTFNNLITTQFMQLQPEPVLSESPNDILPYAQETMLDDSSTTPVDSGMNGDSQMFTFNQQMNVNSIILLPPPQKIQNNDPSYIKLESTIKQNTQSPSLERMCNANILTNQAISREYKASPPLEDIHKNMSEIKNEVKSDAFYNIPMNNTATNPPIIDQYLIDNLIGEQYMPGHVDLSAVVLPEVSDDQQNDVIEIDDNSDDNKLLPRYDMNFPLESLYLMHDFHFLDNEAPANNMPTDVAVNEMNRIISEVPIVNQKENMDAPPSDSSGNDFPSFIQGKKDPMMNTSVRVCTNKINVKNIELMKN
ncbi:RE1-silencing transcription factor-like [Galleria mellonella]|uniref:RE1-silencing transcription factor-like n=1 Tax=Galleria mellonella TaxID=7137 RepID=A0A6J1WV89_GALME|nr:RE1-silencing transcription factor-like [Galleria mellonella]